MITIDFKLRLFRKTIRKNSKEIISHLVNTHIDRNLERNRVKIISDKCIFCGSSSSLSKEHVLPQWTFEKSVEKHFITDVNGIRQTYIKTTVPACANCNNNLLSCLESYIIKLFETRDLKESFFVNHELQNIIRWLEIIEYKFQVLEIRRIIKASKTAGYIPYLADFPISLIREKTGSPSKLVTELRHTQKRLTIKTKTQNVNSLVIFKTKNKDFYFFHTMDDFIFIELPKYEIAMFYFYKKIFKNNYDAYNEAMEIIRKVYESKEK